PWRFNFSERANRVDHAVDVVVGELGKREKSEPTPTATPERARTDDPASDSGPVGSSNTN
ncbi:MAG: hypothetical protein ACM31C_30670, partial [Acidobacteriota bacterium]